MFERIFVDLIGKLKQKNSFTRNFAFTFSGNVFNTVLQVGFAPFLSRIYSPEAYGVFAVLSSLILNLNLVSTLSYSNAILASPKKEKVYSLIALSAMLGLISFSVFTTAALVFRNSILDFFNIPSVGSWLIVVPFCVLLLTFNVILSSYNIFHHEVKRDSAVVLISNVLNKAVNIIYGLTIKGTFVGLLIGDVVSKFARQVLLFFSITRTEYKHLEDYIDKKRFRETAKEFIRYPVYVLPSQILQAISSHVPVYLFAVNFSSKEVGLFSFTNSILAVPVTLFGNSASSIFFRKATEVLDERGLEGVKHITRRLYWNFFLIGLPIFSTVIFWGDDLFRIVFGDAWEGAGEFAMYLAGYQVFYLIFVPLSTLLSVLRKEGYLVTLNIALFITRTVPLVIGIIYNDVMLAIKLFSFASLVSYMFFTFFIFKILKIEIFKILTMSLAIMCLIGIVAYLMHY